MGLDDFLEKTGKKETPFEVKERLENIFCKDREKYKRNG